MAITQQMFPTIRHEDKDWSGLTTSNHLGYMFGENPIQITKFVDTIYKVNLQDDLVSKLNQYPIEYISDDREYEWMLMGASNKNIPLVRATDLSGNAFTSTSTPGKYGEPFYMYFEEKRFYHTHVIVGHKPDLYHLLVTDEPVQIGTDFRIKVQLVIDDAEAYIPYTELAAGTRWSADYSLSTQILSSTGSDISFNSPFKMANRISMIRKKHMVTGDMINKGKNEPIQFAWQYGNDGGKPKEFKTWLNRVDWQFMSEFRREKAHMLMFGKSNRRADGSYGNLGESGYEIKAGMGLRDQISPANKFYYTQFNIENFVRWALDLSVGKVPGDKRNFVVGTGEHGLRMISAAIERYAGANALSFGTENNRMQTLSNAGDNKWNYTRPQFVKFADINGLRFEFMHIPEYDDNVRNKLRHPDGGVVESYRLTLMDFGTSNGISNIQQVRVKGQDPVWGYEAGLRDPFSPGGQKVKLMTTPVDGYTMHQADWCGVKVHNPLAMGEWILNYQ